MADSTAQKPENDAASGSGRPGEPPAPVPQQAAGDGEFGPRADPADGPAPPGGQLDDRTSPSTALAVFAQTALPGRLDALAEKARDYAAAASAENTRRAYAADWRHYKAWARRQNLPPLPPDPQTIGLYVAAAASGAIGGAPNAVSTIERRLSALAWNFAQRGQPMDRQDPHIATVLAGIRRTHGRPPIQKEAALPEHLIAMLATLGLGGLRALRDRALLLVGFAGALRRSELVGLDRGRDQTQDGDGWIEIFEDGMVVTLRGKTGWREIEIGRGSSDLTCPIVALETWLRFARIDHGPLFRRVTAKGKAVGADRLNDRHVARLVKRTALAAGVRPDLTLGEREEKFAGHSLRAGLASSAEIDERFVQNQLGHASPEMTRLYQRRRDRFRVNLTKAAGL